MSKTCENCLHVITQVGDGNQEFFCRRFPPQAFPVPGRPGLTGQPTIQWVSAFTPVNPANHCGEWAVSNRFRMVQ